MPASRSDRAQALRGLRASELHTNACRVKLALHAKGRAFQVDGRPLQAEQLAAPHSASGCEPPQRRKTVLLDVR